jgi:hypothetical protein
MKCKLLRIVTVGLTNDRFIGDIIYETDEPDAHSFLMKFHIHKWYGLDYHTNSDEEILYHGQKRRFYYTERTIALDNLFASKSIPLSGSSKNFMIFHLRVSKELRFHPEYPEYKRDLYKQVKQQFLEAIKDA